MYVTSGLYMARMGRYAYILIPAHMMSVSVHITRTVICDSVNSEYTMNNTVGNTVKIDVC